MPLPISGPISFNDINVELGVAGTTTASLDQASYRALAGVPSGTISLNNFYGKSSVTYFNNYSLTPGIGTNNAGSSAQDSAGNIYTYGTDNASQNVILQKFNASGVAQWRKAIRSDNNTATRIYVTNPTATNVGRNLAIASDGSIYIALYNRSGQTFANGGRFVVAKFDTNGNLLWANGYNSTSNNLLQQNTITAIGTDVYVAGSLFTTLSNQVVLKINGSGTLQWAVSRLEGGSVSNGLPKVATDGTDLYVMGTLAWDADGFSVFKINPSGGLIWGRGYYESTIAIATFTQGNIAANSTGCYVTGYRTQAPTPTVIARLNSADGALSFVNTYNRSGVPGRVAADASFVYVAGVGGTYVMRLNLNGTVNWARTLGPSTGEAQIYDINVSSNAYVAWPLVSADFYGGTTFTKLKLDGTGTGSFAGKWNGTTALNYTDITVTPTAVSYIQRTNFTLGSVTGIAVATVGLTITNYTANAYSTYNL